MIALRTAFIEAMSSVRCLDDLIFPRLYVYCALKLRNIAVCTGVKQKAVGRNRHERFCVCDNARVQKKLLHPEILRMISEIETYKKILNRIDEMGKLACRREKKIMKRLRKDYEILCAYVSNEDNRLRKALGYPRDTLYSFHVLRYGSEGPFKLFVHLMVAVLFVLFEILICFVVSLGTSWLIGIGSLIGSAALVGLVIEIWRFWKNKSPNSFWRFVKEQKRKIKEEEKENT